MNESNNTSNNQSFPPTPPPLAPLQNQKSPPHPDRRQLFASSSRMRTASSSSTRGAFGLMPVDASAHDPEDIYRRQQEEAMKSKKGDRNGNNGLNVVNNLEQNGVGGGGGEKGSASGGITSTATPGQTINRTTGNIAQIARDALRNDNHDEEWGSSTINAQNYGSSSSAVRNSNGKTYNIPPSRSSNNHPYHQQQQQQQQHVSWRNLPQPPSQRYPSYTDSAGSSSLNYSYPTVGGMDHSSTIRTTDADMYYLQSAKLGANQIGANGGSGPGGPVNANGGTKGAGGGMPPRHPSPHPDVHGEKSLGSNSTYSTTYEEEELTWYQYLVYHQNEPEFTSIQQSVWAVFIGIFMGFFTAYWGNLIEWCVEFVWKTVPEYLLEWGVFTDLDGRLPLPWYFVICPAFFGGVLSYFTAILTNPKVPGQNEWIESLHRIGIMDHTMFFQVIIFSTLGMASGLSLGPEMPLILASGMIGSLVAVNCKQSVLSARVMNLTAASAAIGGFFHMPMAGALFVLELPHRMGLQYFEAISPATLASIVSVIVNRMITGDDVKGMFKYPFLSDTLPNNIFWVVIIYGIAGSFTGYLYAEGVLWLKHSVHDWFHAPHDDDHHDGGHDHSKVEPHYNIGEAMPLMVGGAGGNMLHMNGKTKPKESCCTWMQKAVQRFFGIEHEPTRAGVAGIMVGILTGINCMLLPHNLFWGEAQLQTMIDRGMTPLPVFGYGDEPTAPLLAYGYCMVDPGDEREEIEGFSTTCLGVIAFTKIAVVGIGLGSGVCGGHFWAPLFVGATFSHFFTDLMAIMSEYIGFGVQLSAYPCLAVLCFMGSTHVVTYRTHMAIILVLTLSIQGFNSEDKLHSFNGDYSAIFPLLVVACFIPLLLMRNVTFYAKQVCRGDITAIPEVLCEPNKAGTAQIYRIDNLDDVSNNSGDSGFGPDFDDDSADDDLSVDDSDDSYDDISLAPEKDYGKTSIQTPTTEETTSLNSPQRGEGGKSDSNAKSGTPDMLSSSIHSMRSTRSSRSRLSSSSRPSLARVRSKGKIDDSNYQKPLLHQSREGASTAMKKKKPNLPRSHRRTVSGTSVGSDFSLSKEMDESRHSTRF